MASPAQPPPLPYADPQGSDPRYPRPGGGGRSSAIGLAVGAVASGAVAILLSRLSLCGFTAVPVAIIGLIMAVAGVVLSRRHGPLVWLPAAAGVVCLIAVGVGWMAESARDREALAAEQIRQAAENQKAAADRQAAARDAAVRAHLPPFTVTADKHDKPFIGSDSRWLQVSASGDLNDSNVRQIIEYVKARYPADRQFINVVATGPDGTRYTITSNSLDVDYGQLATYRNAAGLPPATQPAR